MNYENWCSRSNPGHIIIVVDQNEYMGEVSSGGLTLAQRASNIVSSFLSELVYHEIMGMSIQRKAKIAIISYGGLNNNVSVIHNRYMDSLFCDDSIPTDTFWGTAHLGTDEVVEIEYCRKRFVEPIANGRVSIVDAFRKVKALVIAENAFSRNADKQFDPVPIILHLSTDISPIITDDCLQLVDSIKRIKLSDGFPLIMNCILTKDESYQVEYPSSVNGKDAQIKLFFDLSSQIPDTFIRGLQSMCYYNLSTNCKAITVNPNERHALDFGLMQFGGSEPYIIRNQ